MSDKLKVTIDVANAPAVVQVLKEARETIEELRAENAALKAQWANVPWKTLLLADDLVGVVARGQTQWVKDVSNELGYWLREHAPQDALDTYSNAPKEEPHP